MKTRQRHIILASASPRRRELLAQTRLVFRVVPSDYQENILLKLKPKDLAIYLASGKAQDVARRYKNAIVIGADTFVVHRNTVIGKPKSEAEAKKMLRMLSGTCHVILTGVTIIDTLSEKSVSWATETKVYMKKISSAEIGNYIKSGEPMDKAGAYAIQGIGAVLIERIEGDYMSAIGLPLNGLAKKLKMFGISIL